jgi:hypothetical protein
MKHAAAVAVVVLSYLCAGTARAAPDVSAEEAARIACDAYVFAYPLVTNTVKAGPNKAPVNQFAHHKQPNVDTLYSTAWLDLSKGPIVLSHPYMGTRFYMFPILDAYTNVLRTPGARDDGGAAASYVITGPGWEGGALPPGAIEIKSPTNTAWILGAAAGWKPPPGRVDKNVDEKTAVRDQVDAMTGAAFFALAAELMGQEPPAKEDEATVDDMAEIGLVPGQPFIVGALGPVVATAVAGAPRAGQERIRAQLAKGASTANGWLVTLRTGSTGTDYDQRALVAAIGLGAAKPEQAVYPLSRWDATGQELTGKNRYVIHFAPGELPPVRGFWSITMYTPQMSFVPNPARRYSVSPRNDLHANDDGSIDIYVQTDRPRDPAQQTNWLPAPRDAFVLMMRMYWPEQKSPSILDGSWRPPPVTVVAAPPVAEAPRASRRRAH